MYPAINEITPNTLSPNRYECEVCHDRFWMSLKYVNHMSKHHNIVVNEYVCELCTFKFWMKAQYEDHLFSDHHLEKLSQLSSRKNNARSEDHQPQNSPEKIPERNSGNDACAKNADSDSEDACANNADSHSADSDCEDACANNSDEYVCDLCTFRFWKKTQFENHLLSDYHLERLRRISSDINNAGYKDLPTKNAPEKILKRNIASDFCAKNACAGDEDTGKKFLKKVSVEDKDKKFLDMDVSDEDEGENLFEKNGAVDLKEDSVVITRSGRVVKPKQVFDT